MTHEVTRRRVLAGVAGAAAVGLAGCGSGDESEAEAATDTTTTTTTTTTTSALREMETYLSDAVAEMGGRNITVDATDRVVTIEYHSFADTTDALAVEIGTVAGKYLTCIERGYDPADLYVAVYDADTAAFAGEYWVKRRWADQLRRGEITRETFIRRIMGSIKT